MNGKYYGKKFYNAKKKGSCNIISVAKELTVKAFSCVLGCQMEVKGVCKKKEKKRRIRSSWKVFPWTINEKRRAVIKQRDSLSF